MLLSCLAVYVFGAMVLNRQALESKLLQQLLAHPELDFDIWSDARLLQSIRETLKQQSSKELWIFAYGSLIWNPIFHYSDRCLVRLENWQRRFCMLAPVGRGTIDNPGLVLGLMPSEGSYCEGIAYRLPIDENTESELLLLWRREMVVGSYIPSFIFGKNGDRTLLETPRYPKVYPLGRRQAQTKAIRFAACNAPIDSRYTDKPCNGNGGNLAPVPSTEDTSATDWLRTDKLHKGFSRMYDNALSRNLEVLTFVVDSQHSTYVNWSDEKIVESLATAKGSLGSSAEYLCNTVRGLLKAGIEDKELIELDNLVKEKQQ